MQPIERARTKNFIYGRRFIKASKILAEIAISSLKKLGIDWAIKSKLLFR